MNSTGFLRVVQLLWAYTLWTTDSTPTNTVMPLALRSPIQPDLVLGPSSLRTTPVHGAAPVRHPGRGLV